MPIQTFVMRNSSLLNINLESKKINRMNLCLSRLFINACILCCLLPCKPLKKEMLPTLLVSLIENKVVHTINTIRYV
jgi:hypothetical protein